MSRRFPVEHQYIVYDESPELKAYRTGGGRELAVLRESDQSYYLREERMGWILGPYEKGAPARFADGVPDWFGRSLFPGDLERLLPHVEAATAPRAVPGELRHQGHRQRADLVHAGRQPFDRPRLEPAQCLAERGPQLRHHGCRRLRLAARRVDRRRRAGHRHAGRRSAALRRYTSKRYVVKKNEETYRNVFTIHFPDEEREDARPAKTSPVYDKIDRMGAVWGQRYGWERANWFAPPGVERKDRWSFRRTNYFEHVGNEVPPDAREGGCDRPVALHQARSHRPRRAKRGSTRLVANKVPTKIGRIALCHALTQRTGGIRSEFTITKVCRPDSSTW